MCNDKFVVEAIEITNKVITGLAIRNLNKKGEDGKALRVFVYKKG